MIDVRFALSDTKLFKDAIAKLGNSSITKNMIILPIIATFNNEIRFYAISLKSYRDNKLNSKLDFNWRMIVKKALKFYPQYIDLLSSEKSILLSNFEGDFL